MYDYNKNIEIYKNQKKIKINIGFLNNIEYQSHIYNIKAKAVIKYLGLYIDNKFSMKFHINQLENKMFGIYNVLKKIALNLNLSPINIANLYVSKCRSLAEFAAIFYIQFDNSNIIQKMENRFIRLCFGVEKRKGMNLCLMRMILKKWCITDRINFLSGKHYFRLFYSHPSHPLNISRKISKKHFNFTFNKNNTKLFDLVHTKRKKTLLKERNLKKKNLPLEQPNYSKWYEYDLINYSKKKVFKKDYKNLFIFKYFNSNKIIKINHLTSIKTLPIYHNILNKNVSIDIIEYDTSYNTKNYSLAFTDGSNLKNPGKSGFAWYLKKDNYNPGHIYHESLKFPSIIGDSEAYAISHLLKTINKKCITNYLPNLIIFSDSLVVLELIKMVSFSKYQYMKLIIDEIFNHCNKIINNGICNSIIFKKIQSHKYKKGIYYGNYLVDKYANKAAKEVKYNTEFYFNVTFNTQVTQWYSILNHRNRNYWMDQIKNYKKNHDNNLKLIYKHIPQHTNKLYHVFKYLDREKASIILKLISETIELKYYLFIKDYRSKFQKQKEENNILSPLCSNCNVNEDINHYILNCNQIDIKYARIILINNINKINKDNNIRIPISLIYLLFPFKFYEKKITLLIWEEITKFVVNSKRFEEKQIN